MNQPNVSVPTISRRQFLVGSGAAISSILHPPSSPIVDIIARVLGSSYDAAEALASTEKQKILQLHVSNFNSELLTDDSLFFTSRLGLSLDDGSKAEMLCTQLNYSKALNVSLPGCDPNSLLRASNSSIFVGPGGYKTRNYRRDFIGPKQGVGLMYPASTNKGEYYGPSDHNIVDRFPGLDSNTNETSGGYYIDNNGKIHLAPKSGLIEAMENRLPFAQLVYYMDGTTGDDLLKHKWSFKHVNNLDIGNTSYYWSMYLQHEDSFSVLTSSSQMLPLSYFTDVARIMYGNDFQMALADGGNGSSILMNKADGTPLAYGVNGFDTHLSPMALVIV